MLGVFANHGELTKALQLFEVREHDNNGNLNFFILYNLASVNRLKMDYNKSLSYGIQTLHLVENKEKFKKYQEITYALVANIYTLSDYNKSIEFYKKAIEVNSKSTKPNYEYRTLYYINLAYAYYQLGKYR
jgi:tetratricopeptide (TPR) repeat protein